MKVEQYKRQAVPGVRQVPYHVKPMDLSEGLRIGAAGTEALGKGIANLGKSIEGVAEVYKKVQAEKDELFGNATFHEFEAEMKAFQPTLDAEKDDEALNLIYRKYGDRITGETSISDESRKRLLQALDNRFEVGRIHAGGTRNRMAVQANINQTQKYFEEARDAGNTDKALILAEELRRKGVGMPSNEAITSICRKNGYETNIATLTYGSLDDLESDIGKALLNGGGFDGMSEKDSILIREQIRKQKRLIEAEDRDRFLADITGGNVPELDALEAEHRNGLVSDRQYVWKSDAVKAWLKEQKRERLHGESQAEKAREKAKKEQMNSFLTDLRISEIPDDEISRKEFFNRKKEEAIKLSKDNAFLGHVWSICGERQKEDTSYKRTPGYLLGMNILEGMKKDFTSYARAADWNWYSFGIRHAPKAGKEVTKTNYDMMKDKLSLWLKNNPQATEPEIRTYLEESKNFINQQAIADLAAAWDRIPTGRTGLTAAAPQTGDRIPGKAGDPTKSTPVKGGKMELKDGRIVEYDGKGWRVVNGK